MKKLLMKRYSYVSVILWFTKLKSEMISLLGGKWCNHKYINTITSSYMFMGVSMLKDKELTE